MGFLRIEAYGQHVEILAGLEIDFLQGVDQAVQDLVAHGGTAVIDYCEDGGFAGNQALAQGSAHAVVSHENQIQGQFGVQFRREFHVQERLRLRVHRDIRALPFGLLPSGRG